ncbi:hypothetical protein BV341_04691 [Pseudomonas syringae pv. actinidiae]|nr:hypothetical protein BV340_04576 [Pseudomonas syringae pv. actinidiae]OSN19542.1 hypothetical protein BV341_04691 [Pseudomonas syringae pv. actinidiae]OSN31134.1 hypothetical protein BV342_04713 [Pseudomonas syringae pv. actinidiae]OSN47489.1 hypothetical protein BV345_04361 [Pseudomonas syringae pv. actinidiae]OSO17947.1 hypothetical protein BV359_04711 [Pseudomonas syringae pv. actinidiae]
MRANEKAPDSGQCCSLKRCSLAVITGYRVFDIFTALGLAGLGRFVMKSTPMLPRSSSRRLGVCDGDTAPAMTTR